MITQHAMTHINRHRWKYAAASLIAGTTAFNWPQIKAIICSVFCNG